MRSGVWAAVLPLLVLAAFSTALAQKTEKAPGPDAPRFFESKIRPVLIARCESCHGASSQMGGLRVDSRAALLKGGASGPAITVGDAKLSELLIRMHGEDGKPQMPMGTPALSPEQLSDFERWVRAGALWPETRATTKPPEKRGANHWAFQPMRRPAQLPAVKNTAWVKDPVDAFILAKLETKKLTPNRPATRRELIRRVTYDLTGLPPTPPAVEAFVADKHPDAYEKLVDTLLASPAYGEKWARHWLDLVRYAETNSYERDNPKPNAWRYRDYVIRALNSDKPFNRFVQEQLAGDEMPDGGPDGLIATGFYRLGIWDDEPSDREQARFDSLDDVVTTVGQSFLGMTFDCARCHDHKIDPIPQKDYYQLVSFFINTNHFRNGGPTDEKPILRTDAERSAYAKAEQEIQTQRDAAAKAVQEFEEGGVPKDGEPRFAAYQKQIKTRDELNRKRPEGNYALCITERGPEAPDTFVLARGNAAAPGDKVTPGFPEICGGGEPTIVPPATNPSSTGRRLALANWIVRPDNRLTARVIVNRVWQHHFGRGIVSTPNDFGLQGARPTHPELLDYLATEFVRQGWSLKKLHRLLLLSNTYQMSSRPNDAALNTDPENQLFWRFNMRRLSAEEIRDSVLAVSGDLNRKLYGPSVYPEMPKAVLAGQSVPGNGWPTSPPALQTRRSIYVHVKRSLLLPILETFDLAETDRTAPTRFASTQPTQALALLNSDFMQQQAALFARRIARDAGDDSAPFVEKTLRAALQRVPTAAEIQRGAQVIAAWEKSDQMTPEAARQAFSLLALNLDEFLYLD